MHSPWLNWKLISGLIILALIVLAGLIGARLWDTSLANVGKGKTNIVPIWIAEADRSLGFKPSDPAHPLGTDSKGRDLLAVLLVGTPRSLRVGVIGAGLGMLIGIALGFTAGYAGGWLDGLISTLADVVLTIPGLTVLIVIAAYVTQLEVNSMGLLMALFAWPLPTRLLRSQVLSLRERGYVQMAKLSGASTLSILFGEMAPNLLPYIAASFTESVSGVILAMTGLETLGLGPTRIPTLGMTIQNALQATAIIRGMWWWWGAPLVMLVIIFVALFLMTIGLDEVANPRLRRRG